VSKRGLPADLKMRHDWHYVEELSQPQRSIGRIIAIDQIEPNPDQPRIEIGDLTDLTASIKEKGVLEPLLVKPLSNGVGSKSKWLIIAGERRWRAARAAGLNEVPCVELNVDDNQVAEIALIENLQRKDLSVWEEADGLLSLSKRFNYTHEDVAKRIGKSRTTVTESLTIANLPPAIRERCRRANINSKSILLQIARQIDDQTMIAVIDEYDQQNSDLIKTDKNNASDNSTAKKDASVDSKTSFNTTDLTHPVRSYNYQPLEGDFKLALKFKKPVNKQELIQVLRNVLTSLENDKHL
jgi:ParB family chromosome partitioning protein